MKRGILMITTYTDQRNRPHLWFIVIIEIDDGTEKTLVPEASLRASIKPNPPLKHFAKGTN